MISARDYKLMRMAMAVARVWSKDPSTKVGCIASGESPSDVAWGYNGFPPGISDTAERLNDRQVKLKLVRHAEPNALSNARFPVVAMHVNRHPCSRCAIDILAHRTVRRVVYLESADYESRYYDDCVLSRELLTEGGVVLESIPEALDLERM
jgi:dCMP deaminase